MEAQLERTRDVVASLRELLSPAAPMSVSYRTVPPLPVLAMTDLVTAENCGAWLKDAYDRLYAAANGAGITVRGPSGATYAREIFEEEVGEGRCLRAGAGLRLGARVHDVEQRDLPGGRFAITVHAGPFDDFDRTYGAQLKERTMSLTIAAVTFDSRDAAALAEFWSALLERPVDPDPSVDFASIGMGGSSSPALCFVAVSDKNPPRTWSTSTSPPRTGLPGHVSAAATIR